MFVFMLANNIDVQLHIMINDIVDLVIVIKWLIPLSLNSI